jgi:hypothetical protein
MKQFIIACCFLWVYFGYAQYTSVPDPNFEQALIDLGIDDDGLNGQFLTANALGVITLQVEQNNIDDLTGIEAFIDLENLYAFENNLTAIDLSVLPNSMWTLSLGNNQLSNIDLSYIPNIVNLSLHSNNFTQIDASNLTSLFIFHVSNQNLTNLNLTNCSNLFSLGMVETSISSIDLSDSTGLTFLTCHDTQLTSLDFTNNFYIEEITCYNTPLTSIHLPNNPNLEFLGLGNNLLTELDVTNCPNLDRLICSNNGLTELDLSGNPVLDHLNCSDNQLTTLDLSNNLLLTELGCKNNNITNIDFFNNSLLELIDCQVNLLEEVDLSQSPLLFVVDFSDNPNLTLVNLQNGNNEEMISFSAYDSPQVSCVVVDDPTANNDNIYVNENAVLVGSIEDCENISVSDFKLQKVIQVFPNPAQDFFFIDSTESITIHQIKIYDLLGRLVLQKDELFNIINFSHLNSGLLFVNIETEQGSITKKVVKE